MGRESKTSLRRGEFIRAKGGGAWVRAEGGGQGQGGRCGPGWAEVVVRHSSHDHQDGARPTPALLLLLLTLLLLPVSPAGPSVSDAAHVLTSESLLFPFRFCVCVYLFLLLYLLLLLSPPPLFLLLLLPQLLPLILLLLLLPPLVSLAPPSCVGTPPPAPASNSGRDVAIP